MKNLSVDVQGDHYGHYSFNKDAGQLEFTEVGLAFKIMAQFIPLEALGTEKAKQLSVKMKYICGNQWQIEEFPRSFLTKQHTADLVGKGVDISANYPEDFFELASQQLISMSLKYTHETLGWQYVSVNQNKLLCFKANEAIGIKSKYTGSLNIEPKGTFEEWKEIIDQEVVGHIGLEFAVVAALNACVIGLFSRNGIPTESTVLNFYGNSSQGKTTAALVGISVAGIPDERSGSLAISWKATETGLGIFLGGNFGMPVLLDEARLFRENNIDFSSILYKLCSGTDKTRGTKDLKLREQSSWATTIFSTGEISLLEKSEATPGLEARVFEFCDTKFTDSKEHANTLKNSLMNQYGTAILKFAEYLSKKDFAEIKMLYSQWDTKIMDMVDSKGNGVIDRRSQKIAMLFTTAELAKTALDIDFHVDDMVSFVLNQQGEDKDIRPIEEKALDLLLYVVATNAKKFETIANHGKSSLDEAVDRWGIVELGKYTYTKKNKTSFTYTRRIIIIKEIFDKIMDGTLLKNKQVFSSTQVLRSWRDTGRLMSENDRLMTPYRLSRKSSTVGCYIIHVFEDKDLMLTSVNRTSHPIHTDVVSADYIITEDEDFAAAEIADRRKWLDELIDEDSDD